MLLIQWANTLYPQAFGVRTRLFRPQKSPKLLRLICKVMSACISSLPPVRGILILMDDSLQGLETLFHPLGPELFPIHVAGSQ